MNLRRFYLILTICLTIFMSVSGITIIKNMNDTLITLPNNSSNVSNLIDNNDDNDISNSDDENNNDNNNSDSDNDNSANQDRPIIVDGDNNRIGVSAKTLNILVLGGDRVNQNTDTIMVVNFNPLTKDINLLSIPRDTKVKIQNQTHKINFAYPQGGKDLAIETISDLLDISIDRYIYIDTSVFKEIIDILGGIEYTIPVDMDYDDNAQNLHIHLDAGTQKLDGDMAEQFMRFRHPNSYEGLPDDYYKYYDGSDIKRINAQQSFIKAIIKQKANLSTLTRIKSITDVIFQKLETDFSFDEALGYAFFINEISLDKLRTFKLSGYDEIIDNIWYLTFDNKIYYDNKAYAKDSIINKYFDTDTRDINLKKSDNSTASVD